MFNMHDDSNTMFINNDHYNYKIKSDKIKKNKYKLFSLISKQIVQTIFTDIDIKLIESRNKFLRQ